MKRLNTFAALIALQLPSLALAADKVMMATSEDLNSFDAQLSATQPAAAQAGAAVRSNAVGVAISAEAKKLKDSGSQDGLGRRAARPLAPGQSIGADGGSTPGAAIGMDSSSQGSKADPGAYGKNKAKPGNSGNHGQGH